VIARVLGETGNPSFLTCKRKCKRNSPASGLSRVLCRPAAPVGGRWVRKLVIDLPEAARNFLFHLLQLIAQEEDASGSGGRSHPAAGMQGVTRRKGGQVGFADPCARVSLISPRRRRDGCAQVTPARRLSRGCGGQEAQWQGVSSRGCAGIEGGIVIIERINSGRLRIRQPEGAPPA
jgi:hypothetical protein